MNSLFTITPYLLDGMWMFDDEARGLVKEPFVCGADEVMDILADGKTRFNLVFSGEEFPGVTHCFKRTREENGGTWYKPSFFPDNQKKGFPNEFWLCPALFKFFPTAPEFIYAKVI
jgi:hypothetical protein